MLGRTPCWDRSPASTSAIAFTPDGTHAYLGGIQVRILNVATHAIVSTMNLSAATNGSAAATVMSTRIMSLPGGDLNFGGVRVGATGTATLTIANSGNSPLIVSSIDCPTALSGTWFVLRSTSRFTQGIGSVWGASVDVPVAGATTVTAPPTSRCPSIRSLAGRSSKWPPRGNERRPVPISGHHRRRSYPR